MRSSSKTIFQKIIHELRTILGVTLYFAVWIGIMMLIKKLLLEDYNIEFVGISIAIVSSLVMAKVVLLMDMVPLGTWIKKQPVIVDVVVRTLLYSLVALFVFLLEKAFESRHENGGFGKAISQIFHNRDIYKVWVGVIVITLSIFWFHVWGALKRFYPDEDLINLFTKRRLEDLQKK